MRRGRQKLQSWQIFIQIRRVEEKIQYNADLEQAGVVVYPFEKYSLSVRRHYYLKRYLMCQLREFNREG